MNSKWISNHYIPAKAKIRLLCFPFGGGGASTYLSWARHLKPEIEIVPVQLPGRETRLDETSIDKISKLISGMLPALIGYLDRPYAMFGHSMGALIAFELSREIRRKNLPGPKLLLLSGKSAAHLKDDYPPIACLPDKKLMKELEKRYEVKLSGDSMALIQMMLPTIRSDIFAVEKYIYKSEPPFDFPIIGFGGKLDRIIKPPDIEAWSIHTTGRFRYYHIDGDHFFVKSKSNTLVTYVRNELIAVLTNKN